MWCYIHVELYVETNHLIINYSMFVPQAQESRQKFLESRALKDTSEEGMLSASLARFQTTWSEKHSLGIRLA